MNKSAGYWLALNKILNLGPATIKKLYDHFGSAEAIWNAKPKELAKVEGLTKAKYSLINEAKGKIDPESEIKSIKGVNFLTIEEEDYPENLRNIFDPPPVLFYKGQPEALNKKSIAIVGTRKPSSYGIEVADRFAKELAGLGFVVVSGMAYGIDTAAHKGALEAKAETIAVFGCGIDKVYPAENIRLAESVAESGCLVSEFSPGTPTSHWTFPQRNRIISGLSMGVIVVEGAQDSGSLITAKLALEQGREVFAVPGQIENQNSKGPHWLIKQGAKLVESVEDVLEEFNMVMPSRAVPEKDMSGLSSTEKSICELLMLEPLHIDVISEKASLSSQEVSSLLMMLEIKGFVKQLPGKKFVKN